MIGPNSEANITAESIFNVFAVSGVLVLLMLIVAAWVLIRKNRRDTPHESELASHHRLRGIRRDVSNS
jgi:heme/copper-type cytochrome/quinol oxidase subunit 2